MTVDLKGTALVITAVCTGLAAVIGPIVTAYLQLKANRKAEVNKVEAIAAREALHDDVKTIIASVAPSAPPATP